MRLTLYILILTIVCMFTHDAHAKRYLTFIEKGLIKHSKKILGSVHTRSLEHTITRMENAEFTTGQVLIFKTVAKTYKEILKTYPNISEKKKKWIYDQIIIRVAFIQFGGKLKTSKDSTLGKFIHKTLLKNFPKKLLKDARFKQTLE